MNYNQLHDAFDNLDPNPDAFGRPGWPCEVEETWLAADAHGPQKKDFTGLPQCGRGDRALFCDQYDRCLAHAFAKDWEDFHCQGCAYERKGPLYALEEELAAIVEEVDEEEEILFDDDLSFDQLISFSNSRGLVTLTLIDEASCPGLALPQ